MGRVIAPSLRGVGLLRRVLQKGAQTRLCPFAMLLTGIFRCLWRDFCHGLLGGVAGAPLRLWCDSPLGWSFESLTRPLSLEGR